MPRTASSRARDSAAIACRPRASAADLSEDADASLPPAVTLAAEARLTALTSCSSRRCVAGVEAADCGPALDAAVNRFAFAACFSNSRSFPSGTGPSTRPCLLF